MVFIEDMYVIALALAVITISSYAFHALLVISFISDWHFFLFVVTIFEKNLSLQYMNWMNCNLMLLLRPIDGFDWHGSSLIHKRFDLTPTYPKPNFEVQTSNYS